MLGAPGAGPCLHTDNPWPHMDSPWPRSQEQPRPHFSPPSRTSQGEDGGEACLPRGSPGSSHWVPGGGSWQTPGSLGGTPGLCGPAVLGEGGKAAARHRGVLWGNWTQLPCLNGPMAAIPSPHQETLLSLRGGHRPPTCLPGPEAGEGWLQLPRSPSLHSGGF